MKTLKTFKEDLFQGGGTNVLGDVRTCCSTSMQLLVEEQMFLGVKQRDTCLEPTLDLEEETSVCAKLTRVGSTVCVLKKVTFRSLISRSGAG